MKYTASRFLIFFLWCRPNKNTGNPISFLFRGRGSLYITLKRKHIACDTSREWGGWINSSSPSSWRQSWCIPLAGELRPEVCPAYLTAGVWKNAHLGKRRDALFPQLPSKQSINGVWKSRPSAGQSHRSRNFEVIWIIVPWSSPHTWVRRHTKTKPTCLINTENMPHNTVQSSIQPSLELTVA